MKQLFVLPLFVFTCVYAQRTAVVDVNLIVGGMQAKNGAGVTQSPWGDSSATVRFLRGKVWVEMPLVDTLLRFTERRLGTYMNRTLIAQSANPSPVVVRPTTANPKLGKDEMLRRKTRIGGLPELTLEQAFADPKLRLEQAIVIDCRMSREEQGSGGTNKITDRGARERIRVDLTVSLYDVSRKRVWQGTVEGVSNDRWKYFQKIMGLRQQDTSLSGREIMDLYALALEKLVAKKKWK